MSGIPPTRLLGMRYISHINGWLKLFQYNKLVACLPLSFIALPLMLILSSLMSFEDMVAAKSRKFRNVVLHCFYAFLVVVPETLGLFSIHFASKNHVFGNVIFVGLATGY